MKKITALILILALSVFSPLCCAFADDSGYDFSEWDDGQMEFLFSQVKDEMGRRGLAAPETAEEGSKACPKCGESIPEYSVFCLWCGTPVNASAKPAPAQAAAAPVLETEHMSINGIAVDDSYRGADGSPVRMVYLFYTLTATDTDMEIDCNHTRLTINGSSEYTSAYYPDGASAMEYMPAYLYSGGIQKIHADSSENIAATFEIPEDELTPGGSVTLSDSRNPDAAQIRFSTGDIQHFGSGEEIASEFDPEGYQVTLYDYKEADDETSEHVRSLVSGRSWLCHGSDAEYEVAFRADGFEARISTGSADSGTYTVRNGYLFCTYDSSGHTLKIPYQIKDGDIELDLPAAFHVTG